MVKFDSVGQGFWSFEDLDLQGALDIVLLEQDECRINVDKAFDDVYKTVDGFVLCDSHRNLLEKASKFYFDRLNLLIMVEYQIKVLMSYDK